MSDADDDLERQRALARIEHRARLRSAGEDELSDVIQREAVKTVPAPSTPAPARGLVAVLNTLPPWGRVVVLVGLLAVLAASGVVAGLLERVFK